jgi:hypothetical protein
MSTIAETIENISDDIQSTFEHLIKLVVRKTLRPPLNPLSPNEKIIHNPFTNRYERAFIGSSAEDNVNKYNYQLTHECLGWTDDYITNFKLTAKFIKSNYPPRKPATINRNSKLTNLAVPFNNRVITAQSNTGAPSLLTPTNLFRNTIENILSRSMMGIISNRRGESAYTTDMSYTDSWKQFNGIGNDIINQTDISIPPEISARMSTSMLRVKLYALEQDLLNLSASNPVIFESLLEMIQLINSLPRSKTIWIINLSGSLTYQKWDDLSDVEKNRFINELGEDFIHKFNTNKLITILLQSGTPELIITTSYLYSLLKMLFVVFGFNNLEPSTTITNVNSATDTRSSNLQSHYERYAGGRVLRIFDDSDTSSVSSGTSNRTSGCTSAYETIDQCTINFIKMFCKIYPTITNIMGGCNCFPDEMKQLHCNSIPANYDGLRAINDFLWRYQDFSYCQYLDVVNSKIVTNALQSKIDDKVRYLKSL